MDRATLLQVTNYIERRIRQAFLQYQRGAGGDPHARGGATIFLSDSAPRVILPSSTLSVGTGVDAAHYDHQHTFYSDAAPPAVADEGSAGTSLFYISKGDHTHKHGVVSTTGGDHTGVLSANARVAIKDNATLAGTRRAINFIAGSNVTLTISDVPASEQVNVTVASSGGGGGGGDADPVLSIMNLLGWA